MTADAGAARSALFWPDSGPGVGLGHLQRCLALADAMRAVGAESVFAVGGDAAERVSRRGFLAVARPTARAGADSPDVIATLARQSGSGFLVVDSYRVSGDEMARLGATGLPVVVIDDLASFPFAADLVVNGGVGARALPYRSSNGRTRFLLGPDYALLHPAYWHVPESRQIADVRRVLITVGGGDPQRFLGTLVAAVDRANVPCELAVVIGPFFEDDSWRAAVEACHQPVRVVSAPDNLHDEAVHADLAVCTAGQTLYELASAGTPAVAFQAFGNQAENLRGLEAAGAIRSVHGADRATLGRDICRAVSELAGDVDRRRAMSMAGRRLVDGRGAIRVAQVVTELFRVEVSPL